MHAEVSAIVLLGGPRAPQWANRHPRVRNRSHAVSERGIMGRITCKRGHTSTDHTRPRALRGHQPQAHPADATPPRAEVIAPAVNALRTIVHTFPITRPRDREQLPLVSLIYVSRRVMFPGIIRPMEGFCSAGPVPRGSDHCGLCSFSGIDRSEV